MNNQISSSWYGRTEAMTICCPAIGPNREGEAKGAAQGAKARERRNLSLRNVRPKMQEEDRKGEISMEAAAIVHDSSHSPRPYLLAPA